MRQPVKLRSGPVPKITILDEDGRWDANKDDEFLWWPRVQWIDPGTVSGVAVVWFDPVAVFHDDVPMARQVLAYSEMFLSGLENGPNGQINRYIRLRRSLAQELGLVSGCESFVPMQNNRSEEFLSPVRIRAGIEARLSMTDPHPDQARPGEVGVPLYIQSPSDAITTYTNDRLRKLRMYTPGPDHINDAKRHCLLYIRKLKAAGFDEFIARHGNEEGWFTDE
jgi:hypothetical protein